MHLPLFVLHDPTILRHMAGMGHYVRFVFHDRTVAIAGPYAADSAQAVIRAYASRFSVEPPRVASSFEELARDMESQPGRRWYWLGSRGDVRAIRGPFGSRREARQTVARDMEAAGLDAEHWELHYEHDTSAYRRTRSRGSRRTG